MVRTLVENVVGTTQGRALTTHLTKGENLKAFPHLKKSEEPQPSLNSFKHSPLLEGGGWNTEPKLHMGKGK